MQKIAAYFTANIPVHFCEETNISVLPLKIRTSACFKALGCPPIAEYHVGCVIGLNTGPHMIGILYLK